MNFVLVFLLFICIVYVFFSYFVVLVPTFFYLISKEHDLTDKFLAAAGCAFSPLTILAYAVTAIIGALAKIFFGLLLVFLMIPLYAFHWLEEHLPSGALFRKWFKVINEMIQIQTVFFRSILGLNPWGVRKKEDADKKNSA
jgi:hypothetical protein